MDSLVNLGARDLCREERAYRNHCSPVPSGKFLRSSLDVVMAWQGFLFEGAVD